jgi:hypothetical protein
MPILRFRLGDYFRLDRLYGICMHKGQTMGAMHADYGASAPTPSPGRASAFTSPPTASTRGSRSRRGISPMPDRAAADSGAFPGVTRATSSCRARSTRPRRRPLRGHSGDPGGVGRAVLRGDDARQRPVERRPRAPDPALQVLRLHMASVAGARAYAARCPSSPRGSKRSSPSRPIPTRSFRRSSATGSTRPRSRPPSSSGRPRGSNRFVAQKVAAVDLGRDCSNLIPVASAPVS